MKVGEMTDADKGIKPLHFRGDTASVPGLYFISCRLTDNLTPMHDSLLDGITLWYSINQSINQRNFYSAPYKTSE